MYEYFSTNGDDIQYYGIYDVPRLAIGSVEVGPKPKVVYKVYGPYLCFEIPSDGSYEISDKTIKINIPDKYSSDKTHHIFHIKNNIIRRVDNILEQYKFYKSIYYQPHSTSLINTKFKMKDKVKFFTNWITLLEGDKSISNFIQDSVDTDLNF